MRRGFVSPIAAAIARRAVWAAGALRAMTSSNVDSCQLDAGEIPQDETPAWIQVAAEGLYKGHQSGEFTLDKGVFDELVRNFRAHPAYKAGSDGYGTTNVIAFDWRHASEAPPAAGGAYAIENQSAHGWARDLETRIAADGKAQLWALSVFFNPARKLIHEKRIQWTSVAIWPNATDPLTGSNIGWYMSSIALTNDPFIQGMQPIAASRMYDPYDRPCTPTEVVERLRRLFGLAEMATLGAILENLATLRAAATGAMAAPPGVDVNELVGSLRLLFNLPTLSTAKDVFDEADKLLGALADEQPDSSKRPSQINPGRPPVTANQNRSQENDMDPKIAALLALIAGGLGTLPTVEAIESEWRRIQLDKTMVIKHLLDTTGAADVPSATAKIKAMLAACGVQDVDAAVKDLVAKAAQMKELMAAVPELEQMLDEATVTDDKAAVEDVGQMLILRGYAPEDWGQGFVQDFMTVLLHDRTGGIDFSEPSKLTRQQKADGLKARKLAREAFLKKHLPEEQGPARPANAHYLTNTLFGGQTAPQQRPAQQLGRMQQGNPYGFQQGGGMPFRAGAPAGFGRPQQGQGNGQGGGGQNNGHGAGEIDLTKYSGNLRQCALAAAQDRMGTDNWNKLTQAEQFRKATEVIEMARASGADLSGIVGGDQL